MLHIGADRVVRKKDVLMMIDLQRPLQGDTQSFLQGILQQGRMVRCHKAKSVVITIIDHQTHALESPISAATLHKRSAQAVALSDAALSNQER